MKRWIWLLTVVLSCTGGNTENTIAYTNPVLHMDYSDPDAIRVGEDYYMTASSFNHFPGLPILHSRDLVHWEPAGAALADYPRDGSGDDFHTVVRHGEAVWAPAIRYHEGWFYIYVGDPDRGIFMLRTGNPLPISGIARTCFNRNSPGKLSWLRHGCASIRIRSFVSGERRQVL